MGASKLTTARVAAARARAAALLDVSEGRATIDDVVARAATVEGVSLRRVRLLQLLAAQPGWSMSRARGAHEWLRLLCREASVRAGSPLDVPEQLTVAFLLDGRADRSVWWALCRERPATPWRGFPFTAQGSAR